MRIAAAGDRLLASPGSGAIKPCPKRKSPKRCSCSTSCSNFFGDDGHWTRGRNGVYTIWVMNKQVRDTGGNAVRGHMIGAFTVRIARAVSSAPPAPKSSIKVAAKVKKSLLD